METEMKAIKGNVSGRVQGVGFRDFVRANAQRLGVTGFVQNTSDSSVEFFIQGSAEQLSTMMEKIKHGPEFSRVDACVKTAVEIDESLSGFDIRF